MIATFLLAAVFVHHAPGITLTEPGAPLARLMPRLAEACNQPLKVSKAIENEVLCVAVKDVSPKLLLGKIALAIGGEWVQEKDGSYLEPDSAARNAIAARALDKRTARLQHFIDEFERLQSEEWDPANPNKSLEFTHDAKYHLLYRVASVIGARTIASLPPGARVVYSNAPTNMQRALSEDLSPEVAAFIKSYGARRLARECTDERPKAVVAKLDAIVECGRDSPSFGGEQITVKFEMYDAKGALLAEEDESIDNTGIEPPEPTPHSGAQPETPIQLSANAKQFLNFITVDFRHEKPGERSEAVQKLLSPEKVDPLAYPGEWVCGAAKARDLQLVAALPDDFFSWFDETEGKYPRDVFTQLKNDLTVVSEQKDGWLTISPADFSTEPVNRQFLGKLAEAYLGKSDVNLQDLIELAQNGFGTTHGSLVQLWTSDICPMLVDLQSQEDWGLLRLLASIPELATKKLLSGTALTNSELGPAGQAQAASLVFGTPSLNSRETNGLVIQRKTEGDPDAGSLPDTPEGYLSEPTEAAPNGLLPGLSVLGKTDTDAILRPAGQSEYSPEQQSEMTGSTAEELGMAAAVVNRDDRNSNRITSVEYDHELSVFKSVQLGVRTTYRVRIYVNQEVYRECMIMIPTFTSAQTYTLQTLPAELQNQFNQSVLDAKSTAKRQQDREAKNQRALP